MSAIFSNPLAIMGIVVCIIGALILLAWRFWGSIRKKVSGTEKFPCSIILSEPKVKECKLTIDHSICVVDDSTQQSWFLWPKAVQRKPDGSTSGLLLTEDSCFPQVPGAKFTEADIEKMCKIVDENIPDQFSSRVGEAVSEIMQENKQNAMAGWLGLAMMGLVACMLVITAGVLISSSNMPWK